MKRIWIKIVKLCGWKFDIPDDLSTRPELQRCVIAVMPHTAIADFFVGAAVLWSISDHSHIFMKKEFFNPLTRGILTRLGVIPVDRGNRHSHLVEAAVDAFASNKDCVFCLTPEATRKPVRRIKRGFYQIATQAQVPIVLGYMNFKTKQAGVAATIIPTGDFDADMVPVREFFRNIPGKYPEKYNPDWR